MKVKIMEWNIHQQGRQGGKDGDIPIWISDCIPEDVSIAVFTEFNTHANNIEEIYRKLKEKEYCYYTTAYSYKFSNDTLIAVRGMEVKGYSYVNAYDELPENVLKKTPENLRVDITIGKKEVHVWGIRIKDLRSDYKNRKVEMDTIMTWLNKTTDVNIVVCDFNNLREGTSEKNWNLNVLDKSLDGVSYNRITPMNHSWGVSKLPDSSFDGYIRNDHLICPKDIKASVEEYKWEFLLNKNYDLEAPKYGKERLVIPVGEPDHGILIGTVEL